MSHSGYNIRNGSYLFLMLDLFRLLFDFGVVVLIWVVQLVIYPSFKYFSREGMQQWHPKYTFRVSLVVMPLMLGQLALAVYQLYHFPDLFTVSSLVLIAIAWALTFFYAVPTHHAFPSSKNHLQLAKRLIFINGLRTFAWTLVFIISIFRYLSSIYPS